MKEYELLRHYYKPIQPTILATDEWVSYHEILPQPCLQNSIYCFWQLKTTKPLSTPFVYRVVADGCIDIFFDNTCLEESFVMGFCKKYTAFPLQPSFDYIGIRFFPSMLPQIFNVNVSEWSNKTLELDSVLPQISTALKQRLSGSQDFIAVTEVLNQIFYEAMAVADFKYDMRFYEALHLILKQSGIVEAETDLNTGLSNRQMRRIFSHYIGTSPKTFSKVIRFQNILHAKPSAQSLKHNKLFYGLGFYDQAHFIKDFKSLYGVTPMQAFR